MAIIKNLKSIDDIQREEIEKEYQDTAIVSTIVGVRDEKTKECVDREVVLYNEIPCRLSFLNKESGVSARSDIHDFASQSIKMFTCPEYDIKPGSRITVIHLGRTLKYECSSYPKTYTTHQEIELFIKEYN